MDIEFWTKALSAVLAAPVIFVLAVAAAGGLIWRLINWAYAREIAGLKSEIGALKERLRLAQDEQKEIAAIRERLERQMGELQEEIRSKAPQHVLAATSASTQSAMRDLAAADRKLFRTLNFSWVNVARKDGGGGGDAVHIDGNYVDAAGSIGTPFMAHTGQHTFETLGRGQKPNWRKVQTIGRPRGNSEDNPVPVTLESVKREAVS